jgi:opacity protein-like surface antigen
MKIFAPAAIIIFCCATLGPAAAATQQDGWYGGAAVGRGTVDLTSADWDDGTLTNKDLKNKGVAYKVAAGYHFTRHFAGELSYLHFDDSKFTAYEPGTTPSYWESGKVFGRARAKGVSLTGVLSWPYRERFAVFARGGVLMWNTTMLSFPTLSGGTLALSPQQESHDDGIRFIYGAGADVRIYRQWRLRAEWEHATVRFAGTMDRGVDFPSLGMTLDF